MLKCFVSHVAVYVKNEFHSESYYTNAWQQIQTLNQKSLTLRSIQEDLL